MFDTKEGREACAEQSRSEPHLPAGRQVFHPKDKVSLNGGFFLPKII